MFSFPNQLRVIETKGNFAKFEIKSLYPGYGVTIGNALRRVLLSSLPGTAITQVKIKGVPHEFSTIPGTLEDVVSILLNLKQLRFNIYSEEPQKATLSIKGEKQVKASDFKIPSQLELVNKDAVIATLTSKKSELEMEIIVEKGLGYETIESRKKDKLEVGQIAVDAIFTPVRKVNYIVENVRVGERTDYDSLEVEIETDGTMSPEEAIAQASEILVQHFSSFVDAFKKQTDTVKPKAVKKAAKKEVKDDVSKIKVEELKLSGRTEGALLKNNIKSAGGLSKKSEKSLLELEGIGDAGVKEIKKALKKLGLEIK